MRDLSKRIGQLSRQLQDLKNELQKAVEGSPQPPEDNAILHQVLETGLVADLADVVDQLSCFFWSYIDQAAHPPSEVDFAQQSRNLEHVTELLRVLRHAATTSPGHACFVSRISLMVEQRLQQEEVSSTTPPVKQAKLGMQRSA